MKNRFCLSLLTVATLLVTLNAYSRNDRYNQPAKNSQPGEGLLPVPQQISLSGQRNQIDDSWTIAAGKISRNDPAIVSLVSESKDRFGLRLHTGSGNSTKSIRLSVKAGSVVIGKTVDTNKAALSQQAYRLLLEPGRISIEANAPQGLFYGVQTLLQLLQPDNGNTYYSSGKIVDWPVLDLRMIYWDDAHHLERLDAMKRAIRQAAFYKINAFSLKLEGHFQFDAAKPLVEPYAYTPKEYQELTDYAKARYVELVPYLDAPAHISFILKHPEYAGLRAFPNSNYELSVTNSKSDDLILGMLNDLMAANKGGKYVFLSTDEAYYIGLSESEKKRAAALGGNGRLLAGYITRISNKLHDKGRKVIIWGEYPLKPSDVSALPSHLINGINGNSKEYGSLFKEHGIRHLVFTSTQGEEPYFPNYYKLPAIKLPGGTSKAIAKEEEETDTPIGRVEEVLNTITSSIAAGKSDFLGAVVCGWADAGLNPETFWLGYATGCAAAWNIDSVNIQDLSNRFYNSFYGNKNLHMDRVYKLLSTQAQFWKNSWTWDTFKNRTPIFGYSAGIFDTPRLAKDQTLPFLPIPSANNLKVNKNWNIDNKELLAFAKEFLVENDELLALLQKNIDNVEYQHYNLQVLLSVAQLCRQNLNMLLDFEKINELLTLSSAVANNNATLAVSLVDKALYKAKEILSNRNEVLQSVTAVWYQDWLPRVAEANGRKYVDEVDDVKDHPPVRTIDMSYLIYRQLKYPLDKWAAEVMLARNEFAKKSNLEITKDSLDWKSIKN